ncbi:MAG: nucleoside 2-deoxyribosyltransferase [Pseudomonadota bacterium]
MTAAKLRVYLAGPEVFLPDAIDIGRRKKALCAQFGLDGLFPLDNDVPIDALAPHAAARRIYDGNIAMLRACDAVIANLTPFRGPGVDDGTAFEVGFAAALGTPVMGYSNVYGTLAAKAAAASVVATTGEDGARDADGLLVEDFALPANLMLACAADADQPSIDRNAAFFEGDAAPDGPADARWRDLALFERCLAHAAGWAERRA